MPQDYNELAELARRLELARTIKKAIDILQFVDPPDEIVYDPRAEDPIEYVAQQYQPESNEEDEELELCIIILVEVI